MLTLASSCLPTSAQLWRDWSRLQAPTPVAAALPMLGVMRVSAGALGLQHGHGVSVLQCALGFVATTLLLVWCWHALRRGAPGAFPAGRPAGLIRYSGNSVK